MAIPQSMSYSAIAGMPYVNGMYTEVVPSLVRGPLTSAFLWALSSQLLPSIMLGGNPYAQIDLMSKMPRHWVQSLC